MKQKKLERDNLGNMRNGWFDRLKQAIERDPRSMTAISLAAGCGQNYVQQMFRDGKEPGADRLARLIDVLGETSGLYVLTGLDLTDADLEFLRIARQLSPDAKARAADLFRAMKADT